MFHLIVADWKTSTPNKKNGKQKRAQRARWRVQEEAQQRHKPTCGEKNVKKTNQVVENMLFCWAPKQKGYCSWCVFRNRNAFLKCCLRTIKYCLSSCRLKNSTLKTPKHAKRARQRTQEQVQGRDKPNCGKKCRSYWSIVEKVSFLNFRKKKNMTQARKEGKEAVGSLQSTIN